MGLAASQVRMLSLTSRKASIERDILQGSHRKIALSREMNNLANEYYDALSAERLMYLSDAGEYTKLSYKYLMGQPGGIENIDVKSDKSPILIDTNSGQVVLSEAMANYIGDPEALKGSADNIYKAIARLCGDANIASLDGAPSYLQFSVDPDLIKDICTGKYDSFDETDLTKAINKYYLTATFINPDNGSIGGTTVEAYQLYRDMDTVGDMFTWNYGTNDAVHTSELIATGTVAGTGLKWAQALNEDSTNTLIFLNKGHTTLDSDNVESTLKDLVNGLASDYAAHTGFDIKDLQGAVNQTVSEFLENTQDEFVANVGSINTIVGTTAYKAVFSSGAYGNDSNCLRAYKYSSNNVNYIGFDPSALVTYFYAAIMGEGVGYISNENGMDSYVINPNTNTLMMLPEQVGTWNYETNTFEDDWNQAFTSSNASNAPATYGNKDKHLFQHFVPAGENLTQWMQNFRDLINDVKFYYPIVTACAKFGYTTDYAHHLQDSEYLDNNIQNGVFQLMGFDTDIFSLDSYKDTDYYLLTSEFSKMNDPAQQAVITAWYETEKAEINAKETYWDTLIENLSTELNEITTEIESVQSLLDDAVKKTFDWGKG